MIRTTVTLAAALAAVLAGPVQAKVTEQGEGGFVSRNAVTVTTDVRATWLALITPSRWWNSAHSWSGDAENLSITPQAGGCFCERIPARDEGERVGLAGSARHMTVVQAAPFSVLRMRGGLGPLQSEPADGVLTIVLSPVEGGGTAILWEYVVGGYMRFELAEISKAVDGVLAEQVTRLAAHLGPKRAEAQPPDEEEADAGPDGDGAAGASVEDALDAMAKDRGTSEDEPAPQPR